MTQEEINETAEHFEYTNGISGFKEGVRFAQKKLEKIEKDKVMFIAFYFWSGYSKQSVWEEFDTVWKMAEEFVTTYNPRDTWEDRSFEEYMDKFIKSKQL